MSQPLLLQVAQNSLAGGDNLFISPESVKPASGSHRTCNSSMSDMSALLQYKCAPAFAWQTGSDLHGKTQMYWQCLAESGYPVRSSFHAEPRGLGRRRCHPAVRHLGTAWQPKMADRRGQERVSLRELTRAV